MSETIMAWRTMNYRCRTCGHEEEVYLQVGLEGGPLAQHRLDHLPVPMFIACDRCITEEMRGKVTWPYGAMEHVDWNRDRILEPFQPVPDGARYFRVPTQEERWRYGDEACGIPERMRLR